jgi:5-methylcytosine-specific restriction enzyme subunit McrC
VKIPIRNLFYLLCYAWDVLDRADELEVGESTAPELENLVAEVLAGGIERLLRRGLEQGYVELREDSKILRGRIDVQQTIKRVLDRRREAHVITEELSPDVLTNQILKASIATLLRFPTLHRTSRERIAGLYHALRGVSEIRVSASSFYRVRLHTNNREYGVLMSICEMLHRYAVADETGSGMRFVDFVRDETKMRKLFQMFVTNFYRRRQQEYGVEPEAFPWHSSAAHHSAIVALPGLHTDIVLSSTAKKIVVETKYMPEPFRKRFGKTILRSTHVNQIFAYMQNVEARDHSRRPVEGILLYPATTGGFCLKWTLFGHPLTSAAVDLSKTWSEIEGELLLLIGLSEPNVSFVV